MGFPAGRAVTFSALLDLDLAQSEFEAMDPARARLIELRFFGGLSVEEAATVWGLHQRLRGHGQHSRGAQQGTA